MMRHFPIIVALTVLFAAPSAPAGEAGRTPAVTAKKEPTFWTRDQLTGDWFGARPFLKEHGITIDLSFTEYYSGLFQGGIADKSFEFGSRADAIIRLDTGKLGLWEGGGVQVHLETRFGDSAERTSPRSGGLWPPNAGVVLPLGAPERVVASSIFYSQKLWDSASFIVGKINAVDLLAGDPFFGGWARDRFTNIAFVAPPSGVVPPTIFGTIINYTIKPVTITAMVFDPDDQTNVYWVDNLFTNGVNLSLGATWSGKIAGRKTTIGATGIYSTKEGADLSQFLLPADLKTGTKKGSFNVALSFSHLLYELPDNPGKGFGVYAKAAIADGNPNPIQSSFAGGFAGHGVVPHRPRDVFGVGYYFYNLSDDLQDAGGAKFAVADEMGVEMYYNFAVTPWLHLTAGLQWIDPANPKIPQAWVGGLRANITF